MQRKPWLFFAVVTTLFWGVWGAFISAPESAGFPNTLSYCVWALTTIPCSLIALRSTRWKLDHDGRSIYLGSMVGFLGAGGQVVLFLALRMGPAYLIFPLISLYPVITVFLSMALLHERASRRAWSGIILALVAIPALNYVPPDQSASRGHLWIVLSLIVFAAWGVQAYYMKFANESMQAESIYFYMMATAVVLIPAAAWMTDFSKPINWGLKGPFLAAAIQVLNSIGALTLVYAMRYGKAMIVAPMTALAPVLTTIISLTVYQVMPHPVIIVGMVLASAAIYLLAE